MAAHTRLRLPRSPSASTQARSRRTACNIEASTRRQCAARRAHLQADGRKPRLGEASSEAHVEGRDVLVQDLAVAGALLDTENELEQLHDGAEDGPLGSAADARLQRARRLHGRRKRASDELQTTATRSSRVPQQAGPSSPQVAVRVHSCTQDAATPR